MKLSIRGIQEAQAKNIQRMAALRPSGPFGQLIHGALTTLHRLMTAITHVRTGALRASERMDFEGLRGRIFLDPGARNPDSGVLTSEYGPIENARGGEHAFFDRTVDMAPQAVATGVRAFLTSIP